MGTYVKKPLIQGRCKKCNTIFYSCRIQKRFCSDRCAYLFHYSKKCKPFIEKKCFVCGKLFSTRIEHRKYCNKECNKIAQGKYYNRQSVFPNIPAGTVGTISELIVATDLLKKGYEVYRPLSPSCSADLLAEKKDKIFKIEVRTGYKNLKGKIFFPPNNIKAPIIGVVLLKENSIKYISIASKQDILI